MNHHFSDPKKQGCIGLELVQVAIYLDKSILKHIFCIGCTGGIAQTNGVHLRLVHVVQSTLRVPSALQAAFYHVGFFLLH
jgi:hypothetical protein